MSLPFKAMRLKTPAALYYLTEVETEAFGLIRDFTPAGQIWGDFQPDDPRHQTTGEGETYLTQTAHFTCRHDQGLMHGAVLRIDGIDWTVQSLGKDADGYVRLGLERVPA